MYLALSSISAPASASAAPMMQPLMCAVGVGVTVVGGVVAELVPVARGARPGRVEVVERRLAAVDVEGHRNAGRLQLGVVLGVRRLRVVEGERHRAPVPIPVEHRERRRRGRGRFRARGGRERSAPGTRERRARARPGGRETAGSGAADGDRAAHTDYCLEYEACCVNVQLLRLDRTYCRSWRRSPNSSRSRSSRRR